MASFEDVEERPSEIWPPVKKEALAFAEIRRKYLDRKSRSQAVIEKYHKAYQAWFTVEDKYLYVGPRNPMRKRQRSKLDAEYRRLCRIYAHRLRLNDKTPIEDGLKEFFKKYPFTSWTFPLIANRQEIESSIRWRVKDALPR